MKKFIKLKTEYALILGMLVGLLLGLLTMNFFLALDIMFMTTLAFVGMNHYIGEKRMNNRKGEVN